ncbi:citrate synthase family protein [Marinobacter similis]|uniref:hypothetical protein n=1 Tax=Marinobacter similis TaxID=1420916 RepID=UPI00191BEB06|nr:hypothetical protein [Marinobacter similis]
MATEYQYHSNIWLEEPEPDNPFAAKACYCSGYDVYGDVIPNAGWFEYLLLMFKGERPEKHDTVLLERLAMVLANPGPREASVRAAMNGGVAGTNTVLRSWQPWQSGLGNMVVLRNWPFASGFGKSANSILKSGAIDYSARIRTTVRISGCQLSTLRVLIPMVT